MVDNDPWGYYIYSVVKQGSINLAFEKQPDGDSEGQVYPACPGADPDRYGLPRNVGIKLNEKDITRAKELLNYRWLQKPPWQDEVKRMLSSGLKYELDALANKDFRYLTKTYLPGSSKKRTGWTKRPALAALVELHLAEAPPPARRAESETELPDVRRDRAASVRQNPDNLCLVGLPIPDAPAERGDEDPARLARVDDHAVGPVENGTRGCAAREAIEGPARAPRSRQLSAGGGAGRRRRRYHAGPV